MKFVHLQFLYLVFVCFHNPPNYDMDYRVFNVPIQSFNACIYTCLFFLFLFLGGGGLGPLLWNPRSNTVMSVCTQTKLTWKQMLIPFGDMTVSVCTQTKTCKKMLIPFREMIASVCIQIKPTCKQMLNHITAISSHMYGGVYCLCRLPYQNININPFTYSCMQPRTLANLYMMPKYKLHNNNNWSWS